MTAQNLKAIILAAGKGTRMKPYTETYQKTMIPIHGKPLLEYIINGLIHAGLKDFIIVVGYRKEQIIDYFGNGNKWDINISYVVQQDLNGTGGALLLCEEYVKKQHFFLTWGDILVSYKIYRKVIDTFNTKSENFILVTNHLDDIEKGCAIFTVDNYCVKMVEKPPKGTINSTLNNCGIFLFSREIFNVLHALKPSERGEIELPAAINIGVKEKKWKVRVIRMTSSQFRGDFGDLGEYERLKNDSTWLNDIY